MVEQGLTGLVSIHGCGLRDVGEGEIENGYARGHAMFGFALKLAHSYGIGTLDLHVPRGDSARFIQAQHIDASEGLDAIELLGKHLAARQPDGGDCKNGRGEQDQALLVHA